MNDAERSTPGPGRDRVRALVPLLGTLASYDGETFRADLVAGLTVAVMLVPQSMAYAALAGMPPIAGLYASIVPLLAYAAFGTSRSLAVGPVALVSLLTASTLGPLAGGDPQEYVELAAVLALLVGAMQVGLGLLRAGRLVTFLSHGVLSGFTSAASIVIAVSQVPGLLGFSVQREERFLDRLSVIFENIDGTSTSTAVIGVGSVIGLVLLRRHARKLPGALIVVATATTAVALLGLSSAGVPVLGEVPSGLSLPSVPSLDMDVIVSLLGGAVTISVIGYAEGIGIAKAIGARTRERVLPDNELWSVGAANLAAGFFQAFPVAGGISRSAVNHEAGARTTVASLITALTVAVTVVAFTPLFTDMPKAVLSAVVVAAVLRLVDLGEAVRLFRFRPLDGAVLGVTFLVTLFVSVEVGLAAGLIASIAVFVWRSSTPHIAELGRMAGTGAYRNRLRYEVEVDPDVVIVRVDGPLFYASAQDVHDTVIEMSRSRGGVRGVVLDASAVTDIDADGMHVLGELLDELAAVDVALALATVRGPVRDLVARSAHADSLGPVMAPDIPTALELTGRGSPDVPYL